MGLIKRKRRNAAGKLTQDANWTVDFADHAGIRRRIPGFTNRNASAELERTIRHLVSLRQAGGAPDAALNRQLEAMPSAVRDKLAKWGVIEAARAAAGKSLGEHVADWRSALSAKGNSIDHIKESTSKVGRLIKECKWQYPTDIAAAGFDKWRIGLRDAGAAAMTLNHYLTVAKTFCNWMVKERRITENPLAHLSRLNAAADRRIERHPYSLEELGMLLSAAETGPVVNRMLGTDRALLYRTAVETGFRWNELGSLTRASFDFSDSPATVTIKAEDAKNGKEDTLPLRPELAADLQARMALFLPSAKAFPGMWKDKGAEMIRVDLEAAGILSRDGDGELIIIDEQGLTYDFHGLRHTFATLLNKARVPLATAQRLMRHSDPKLTSAIYTHVLNDTKAEALSKLPAISATHNTQEQQVVMTGTDATVPHENRDTPRDTFSANRDTKIRTYTDKKNSEKGVVCAVGENKKAPVPQGSTGANNTGTPAAVRTRDLRFRKPALYPAELRAHKGLQ